jgi:hypothetical protein
VRFVAFFTRAESDLLKELVRSPCQAVSREKLRYAVARISSIAAWICLSRGCGGRSSRIRRFPDSTRRLRETNVAVACAKAGWLRRHRGEGQTRGDFGADQDGTARRVRAQQ